MVWNATSITATSILLAFEKVLRRRVVITRKKRGEKTNFYLGKISYDAKIILLIHNDVKCLHSKTSQNVFYKIDVLGLQRKNKGLTKEEIPIDKQIRYLKYLPSYE